MGGWGLLCITFPGCGAPKEGALGVTRPPCLPPQSWLTSGTLPPNEVAAYLALPVMLVASQYASTALQKVPGQVCPRSRLVGSNGSGEEGRMARVSSRHRVNSPTGMGLM